MSMKNSNDTIGIRTRELPACNAVPQPISPPRAPIRIKTCLYSFYNFLFMYSLMMAISGRNM
jgi:hypothetical protein